jgi:hypothetical protein
MCVEALRNRHSQFASKATQTHMGVSDGWPLPGQSLLSDPFEWINDYVRRQEDEEYWRQWDIAPHHGSFDRPSWHVASWFDIFCEGTLKNFIGMRAHAPTESVRRNHRLIIGPWIHGPYMYRSPEGCLSGEMDFGPEALWDYKDAMLRWFDHWLKSKNNGVQSDPEVQYFVMGLNKWKVAADWPPPGIEFRRLYLSNDPSGSSASLNDGSLFWQPTVGERSPARYLHDPDAPVPSIGGTSLYTIALDSDETESWHDLNAQAGSRDQQSIEPRCLTYTTAPLDRDLEITGPVAAVLHVSSDAVDTDFVVRLCDVHPDGRSMLICDGIQRARYRDSDFVPSLLEPGQLYVIKVDLWSTSALFRAGHRVRLIVNSSCYPRFDVNPGTGKSALLSSERRKTVNCIYADSLRSSHVVLPVAPQSGC